jgi:hypothetical protein
MLVRFLAGLAIVLAVAIWGTRLENQNRELIRRISLQHYRAGIARREHAQARLQAEQAGAPARLLDRVAAGPRISERSPD